ncbi:MAG TPA: GNVR domain-containing protein [Pseudolabrys sp.]|nr:GNVR domain-containing protein [Pseudolabrys sp.]
MGKNRLRALPGKLDANGTQRENVSFSDASGLIWQSASFVFCRRNAKLISVFAIIGLAIGISYLSLAPAMFTAKAQLLIEPKLPQFLQENASDSSHVLDSSQLESHMVLLQSERVATAVIEKLNLLHDPEFQEQSGWAERGLSELGLVKDGKLPDSLDFLSPLVARGDGKDPMQTAVKRFADHLRVRRIGISYAVEVAFSSRDAAKAARIANATTDAYLQTLIDFRADAARVASQWLEDRLAQLRVQMNAANIRAQRFKAAQDYRIVKPSDPPKPVTDGIDKTTASPGGGQTTLDELELTADTYRKVYQNFFSAFTEAVQRESYPVSNVQVVSKAVAPDHKSSPKTLIVLALALAVGAFIGACFALLRDVFSHRPPDYPLPEKT